MTRLSVWGYLISLLIVLLAFSGCGGGSATSPDGGVHPSTVPVGGSFTTDLIAGAGQGWPATGSDVGTVTVSDDGTNMLTVEYQLDDPYQFCSRTNPDDPTDTGYEVHLYVGNNPPTTVAPGQYPFDDEDASVLTEDYAKFVIDLAANGLTLGQFYIIAHAKVRTVTTEGGGTSFWTYSTVTYGTMSRTLPPR